MAVAATVLVGSGCEALRGTAARPTPRPCGEEFNAVRCLAMTDTVANELRTTREDVVTLQILPAPTPRMVDGQIIIEVTSGGRPIDVEVTLADGTIHAVTLYCVGVNTEPACVDDPHLPAQSVTQGGYFDSPEGASPVPSAAPDALAEAAELRIDRLDIPIDHVGAHAVTLGEARLPNGLLTTADFELVDDWPADLTIIEGGVHLEIRSMVDGKPIFNIYEHGWREGPEPVEAFLIFDVFRFDPGATLSIRDVVVR